MCHDEREPITGEMVTIDCGSRTCPDSDRCPDRKS